MVSKEVLKKQAILLRKQGKTYSEILQSVPVAKSTLSLWLRDVGLAKTQQQRLTKKRVSAQMRGAKAMKDKRIARTKEIQEHAMREIGNITKRELWLLGTVLYWTEGSKEKEWSSSVTVDFINSDTLMIRLFLKWLIEICGVKKEDIILRLYIHENKRLEIKKVIKEWSQNTDFSIESFKYVYFKKHNPKTKRKNQKDSYIGALRVTVKKSSSLNRKIAGWTKGIQHNTL